VITSIPAGAALPGLTLGADATMKSVPRAFMSLRVQAMMLQSTAHSTAREVRDFAEAVLARTAIVSALSRPIRT
jgi:hypothetical protein